MTHRSISTEELAELLLKMGVSYQKKTKDILEPSSHFVRERWYFKITWRGFQTVVSERDCPVFEEAFRYCLLDKLQAWYPVEEAFEPEPRVERLTHGEFCDWLRSHY